MQNYENSAKTTYKGHLRSSGNSVLCRKWGKNSVKLYKIIYSDSSVFPLQMIVETIWIHCMLDVQDIGELGPCHDSGRKSEVKMCDFRSELIS